MSLTYELQGVSNLNASLEALISATNKDNRLVIQQTGALLAQDFMDSVPPFVNKMPGVRTNPLQRKMGEQAVLNDLKRAITPAEQKLPKNPTSKWMREAIRTKDADALNKFFDSKGGKKSKYAGWKAVKSFDATLHTGVRNKRKYDVNKKHDIMTLDNKGYKKYATKIKNSVGYLKAGWAVAIKALHGSAPAWVTRHLGYAKGSVQINLPEDPEMSRHSVTMSNYTPTVSNFKSGYEIAMRLRAGKMLKDAQFRMAYNLKKFGNAKGIK